MYELTLEDKETIYHSLLHLGVIRWNKSSKRMEMALQYVVQQNDIHNTPVLNMYVDVAKQLKCKWCAVERSLRYMLHQMWEQNNNVCSELFFHTSEPVSCPSVSEFLYIYQVEFHKGNIQRWNRTIEVFTLTDAFYEER